MEPIDKPQKVPLSRPSKEETPADRHNIRASRICETILKEANTSNMARLKVDFAAFCSSILKNATTPPELLAKIEAARAKLDSLETASAAVSAPPPPRRERIEAAPRPGSPLPLDVPATPALLAKAERIFATINSSANRANAPLYLTGLDDICYQLLGKTNIPPTLAEHLRGSYQLLVAIVTGHTSRRPTLLASDLEATPDRLRKAIALCAIIKTKVETSDARSLKIELDEMCYYLVGKGNVPPLLAEHLRECNYKLLAISTGAPLPKESSAPLQASMLRAEEATAAAMPTPISRAPPPMLSAAVSPHTKAHEICEEILNVDLDVSNIVKYRETFNQECLPLLADAALPVRVRTEIKSANSLLQLVEKDLGIK